jgi:2-amino-4-hydroxy-6-hydroxymethyldihydropteridine diphosphokinase
MIKNTSNVYLHRLKFSQSGRCCGTNRLILGLGANIAGAWGSPEDTLLRALDALRQQGLVPLDHSDFFRTKPVGGGRQPDYLNAVLIAEATLAPAALLRLVKGLERKAGRRPGRRLGPRPLDIDILDYGGRRLGWAGRNRRRAALVLPHPEAHRRAFVLVPLAQVAPQWRHPVLRASARTLLRRLGPKARQEVVANP